jgi:hypothetical protein
MIVELQIHIIFQLILFSKTRDVLLPSAFQNLDSFNLVQALG